MHMHMHLYSVGKDRGNENDGKWDWISILYIIWDRLIEKQTKPHCRNTGQWDKGINSILLDL